MTMDIAIMSRFPSSAAQPRGGGFRQLLLAHLFLLPFPFVLIFVFFCAKSPRAQGEERMAWTSDCNFTAFCAFLLFLFLPPPSSSLLSTQRPLPAKHGMARDGAPAAGHPGAATHLLPLAGSASSSAPTSWACSLLSPWGFVRHVWPHTAAVVQGRCELHGDGVPFVPKHRKQPSLPPPFLSRLLPNAERFTAENGATRPTPDWGFEVLLHEKLVSLVLRENRDDLRHNFHARRKKYR